jgi:hypothetical protein
MSFDSQELRDKYDSWQAACSAADSAGAKNREEYLAEATAYYQIFVEAGQKPASTEPTAEELEDILADEFGDF